MGKSCLTEKSELQEQEVYNPAMDYDEFKEEVNPDDFEVE